jgi:hypothetical protein
MSDKIKYKLTKLLCFILSMLLSFSLIALSIGGFGIGFMQSQDYIESRMNRYSDDIINEINADFVKLDGKTNLPVEAFTTALDQDEIQQIISTVVNNFIYNYQTDFSQDDVLYNDIKSSMSNYCNENSIVITDNALSKDASLAIHEINSTIGGSSSSSIKVVRFVQGQKMMYIICTSIILIIATIVILDLINFGRHRKFSYIGMSLITAGYVIDFGFLFVKYRNYVGNYKYSSVDSFNLGIADCVNDVLLYTAIVGAVFIVAGIIMLLLNYNYFRKKGIRVKENRQRNSQLRKEYLEQYNAKKYQVSDDVVE